MYASASKSLNFFWKLSLADSVSAFGALRSFLTNRRSAALVFLFAGYFFPGIPDGFFPHVDWDCYMFCHVFTTIDELVRSVFNNGVYDNLGEAGLFVIRTIFSIQRIFELCFWKWGLYVAELGCGFCMTIWVRQDCLSYEQYSQSGEYLGRVFGNGICMRLNWSLDFVWQMYVCTLKKDMVGWCGWSSIFCVRMYLFGFVWFSAASCNSKSL